MLKNSPPRTPHRAVDGLVAGTLAAFVSLIGLFVVLAIAFAFTEIGTAAVLIALIVVAVGVLFVPIASFLGWLLALADAAHFAWLVGPLAGGAIGLWIGQSDEPMARLAFVGIGLVFGLANAGAYVRIMRSRSRRAPMPGAPRSVGSGADESWSKGTTGEQPQNAEPEGVGQPCGPS